MTKRQMIDEIMTINRSAHPGFLAQFDDDELGEYLDHLVALTRPTPRGEAERFDQYFTSPEPAPAAAAPAATCTLDRPDGQGPAGDRWLF